MRILDYSCDSYFLDLDSDKIKYTWVPLTRSLHPHTSHHSSPHWVRAFYFLIRARLGKFDWVILPPVHLNFTNGNSLFQIISKKLFSGICKFAFTTNAFKYFIFSGKCKYAIFDFNDCSESLGKEIIKLSSANLYFKRNLDLSIHFDISQKINIQPLPMIFSDKWLDKLLYSENNKMHLFFSAGDYNSPERIFLLNVGKLLSERSFAVDLVHEKVELEEFWRRISSSHFCAAAQGVGYHSWRMYEAAALGAVPVINRPPDNLWTSFKNGENCIFIEDSVFKTADLIESIYNNIDELNKIKTSAKENIEKHHRASSVAKNILLIFNKYTDKL